MTLDDMKSHLLPARQHYKLKPDFTEAIYQKGKALVGLERYDTGSRCL